MITIYKVTLTKNKKLSKILKMTYTYSICHPDKSEIEYPEKELNSDEVIELIKKYSWLDILKSMSQIPNEKIYYSPSLDFKHLVDNRSLGITATLENEKPEFSLWYNRPVKIRPLFGLLAERTKMQVVDKWDFSLDKAIEYYHLFLNQNYEKLEKLMTEK